MSAPIRRRAATLQVLVFALMGGPLQAQMVRPAEDADVQGAIRLFSVWLESQIAYRGLPGVVVGVVSDQELVWAKGFGYANVEERRPM
jgi:D-alanyl-D-alanine carboxypeptidase